MWVLFFFKQKTAYEMLRSLVGSEMCIRDRKMDLKQCAKTKRRYLRENGPIQMEFAFIDTWRTCLLYTSDAADDLLCVDLGGRRIINKKKELDTDQFLV